MNQRLEEAKKECMASVEKNGLDAVKKGLFPMFNKMIYGTQLKRRTGTALISAGYERIDPDCLEVVIQCVVEAMPEGDEKKKMEENIKYWNENRQEIMDDHGVTPLVEKT